VKKQGSEDRLDESLGSRKDSAKTIFLFPYGYLSPQEALKKVINWQSEGKEIDKTKYEYVEDRNGN
tara:strand:- start:453 stop:650 length:198 start_codon:yes stop_codon:yes gene_type:complete